VTPVHPMKASGGMAVKGRPVLVSGLDGFE